jgi:hypothetical protein
MLRVLFLLLSFSLSAASQGVAQADTYHSIPERAEQVVNGPIWPHADSIKKHLPLVTAYLEYNVLRRPQWFTPLSDRTALFFERGRAHMLGGMIKAVMMADLAHSESGVLPVTESAIADLDSAAFYFRKIEPFATGEHLRIALADRQLALAMTDSLKLVLEQIKATYSYYPAMQFSPWAIIRVVVGNQPDSLRLPKTHGVGAWMMQGAVLVPERNTVRKIGGK